MENVWIQYSINVWVQLKTIKKPKIFFRFSTLYFLSGFLCFFFHGSGEILFLGFEAAAFRFGVFYQRYRAHQAMRRFPHFLRGCCGRKPPCERLKILRSLYVCGTSDGGSRKGYAGRRKGICIQQYRKHRRIARTDDTGFG